MSGCIFCRIVVGEIPATLVHADEQVIAFRDVNPQAPVHVLVVPRRHVASLAELAAGDGGDDAALGAALLSAASRVARAEGLAEPGRGFRLVANTGPEGGQSVDHLHFHVLGGRPLAWPPG
jgi:histidine triad (HIT) family protein